MNGETVSHVYGRAQRDKSCNPAGFDRSYELQRPPSIVTGEAELFAFWSNGYPFKPSDADVAVVGGVATIRSDCGLDGIRVHVARGSIVSKP